MKNNFKNTLTLLVAVAILSIVAGGCSSLFKSKTDSSSSANTGTTSGSTNDGLAKSIVGTWEGSRVKFIFSDSEMTIDDNESKKTAKYKVVDEETIEIQPPGQSPLKSKVKISGDTMTIEDRGKPLTLKRIS